MSKKARLRRRLEDIDVSIDDLESQIHVPSSSKGLNIRNKFTLNEVHNTFLKLCLYEKTKMVLVDGPAGTAKSYLAVLAGLELLQAKKVENIVYIRSIVESATKSIGALPGELGDKFRPWSLPLIDKLHELVTPAKANELLESNIIKCIPVNFVRGLTFHNSFVIIDEAQNLTRSELNTILTRFGHNTKYVVIGDTQQRDIGNHSGFSGVCDAFNNEISANHDIHFIKFQESEIVRSAILRFIVKMLGC